MRRTLVAIGLSVLASQPLTAATRRAVSHAPWVERASPSQMSLGLTPAPDGTYDGVANRPIVLIETNYYTFLPNEPLQVRITTHPNGYRGAVSMYLYREDRESGERRYYNIGSRDLLPAGQQSDLFGAAGSGPIPVLVPQLTDFVLFGSASDPASLSWGINGALGGSISTPSAQTGLYQYVLELRDAAGKRVISRSNAMYSYVEESVAVQGTLTQSATWVATRRYVLSDFVGVAAPATLTIEPGTVIYGGDSKATLFIQRGAKIVADGTARRPIVFTSPQRVGNRKKTDWGSLVILGNAPINDNRQGAGEAVLEGLPDQPAYRFGGTNPTESSGVLRYVRLEFGGFAIATGQEINGLTLAGVGNGTVVDFIQVLHNKDDGFEFFGGTVNGKHLVSTADDDAFDYDLGWQGNLQYVVSIRRFENDRDESDGNVLIEADGHPQTFTLTPLSNPRIYNATGFGTGSTTNGNYGAVFRRGTAGKIYNVIITGSRRAPVTMRDDATFNNAAAGELVISNSIFNGSFADAAFPGSSDRALQTRTFVMDSRGANRSVDPLLAIGAPSDIKTLMPDLTPLPDSPALDVDFVAQPPDNGFFDRVDFLGAIPPGNNWLLTGWANWSDN